VSDRLSSGSAPLDLILGGGLVAHATHLIIGLPGSGKTILAQQYLFQNSTRERPGIYFSTVSEPLEKMLRFGQDLAFFDRGALGDRDFFEDLGTPLHAGGLPSVLDTVARLLQERRPGLVVIDSFKALRPYAGSEEGFRRFLHGLNERSSGLAMTSFWVGEYNADEIDDIPEAAVADGILFLSSTETDRQRRSLHVLKMRGSTFLSGGHTFRVSDRGIEAYPRLTALDGMATSPPARQTTTSSGIPGLDEMLGGFQEGSSTLLIGPAGIGKSVLGLHFLFQGARSGEPVILAGLQENPTQLEQLAQGFGATLEIPYLTVFYRAPLDLELDVWVGELLHEVAAVGARRVLVDGLGDLSIAAGDPAAFQAFVYALAQRLSRAGVSTMFTQEAAEFFGATSLTHAGLAHRVDNVVLMNYVIREGLWTRALTVLKSRGQSHSSAEAQFRILDRGIEVMPGSG
jgi:circadian clock protein KaiC